jgi:hypothetical protein
VTLPQISNRSEPEMIAAVLAGEIKVYHELIRPYERSVYVMAFSYMKNREQFDSGNGDGSIIETLESEHRSGSGLDPAMILLN